MLDRHNYYATTGGHGACRGCGEVTAIRLVTGDQPCDPRQASARADPRSRGPDRTAHRQARLRSVDTDDDPKRKQRIAATLATLEKSLYLLESGPRGDGPASAVIANATGCSSVYASTFPFNPYTDPWVNSLFQDSPAVAKGVFEGLGADAVEHVRAAARRQARTRRQLRSAGARQGAAHAELGRVHAEELATLPTVLSIGGDGATYDIGFGALSRVLSHFDADQGRGAQHRRLLQHRRPGLDRQPHRPGLRPRPLRRRPFGQAGTAQGARAHRRLPPERLRRAELRLDAGALPQARGRVPQPQRLAGGARRLHALPGRAGDQPIRRPTATAAWRSKAG